MKLLYKVFGIKTTNIRVRYNNMFIRGRCGDSTVDVPTEPIRYRRDIAEFKDMYNCSPELMIEFLIDTPLFVRIMRKNGGYDYYPIAMINATYVAAHNSDYDYSEGYFTEVNNIHCVIDRTMAFRALRKRYRAYAVAPSTVKPFSIEKLKDGMKIAVYKYATLLKESNNLLHEFVELIKDY